MFCNFDTKRQKELINTFRVKAIASGATFSDGETAAFLWPIK
jgi:hypothetical protein